MSNSPPDRSGMKAKLQRWLVQGWRLLALAAAAYILAGAWRKSDISPPDAALTAAVRAFFPDAAEVGPAEAGDGARYVADDSGNWLGYVRLTSPLCDDITGYAGPSRMLIALDADDRVIGVELLESADTAAHVEDVRRSGFLRGFRGWQAQSEPPPRLDAVSGSTLTTAAIAESVERRLGVQGTSRLFPDVLTLTEIQKLFPQADAFSPDTRKGWHAVMQSGARIGYAVRSSPAGDRVRGYAGPTEVLAAVSADGLQVTGALVRRSYDSADYVDRLLDDPAGLDHLVKRPVAEWAAMNVKTAGLEGISGATQTSYAVAESLHRTFAAAPDAPRELPWREIGLVGICAGALAMAFTRLRGKKRFRLAWQAVLIAGFGFVLGDLLSISLLAGWSRHGVPALSALLLLAAMALLIPWSTGRQIYCHQICPHGALQEWLGRFPRLHWQVPQRLHRVLLLLPAVLLGVLFLIAVIFPAATLAVFEPFDAWVLKTAAVVSGIIAIAGLAASVFVPQAYCRYGCPTGALLKFVRKRGAGDAFARQDGIALLLLLTGAALVFVRPFVSNQSLAGAEDNALTKFHGSAFGTKWSVSLRGLVPQRDTVYAQLSAEAARIEKTLSHWHPGSATAQFNAAETTLAMEVPAELIRLVETAAQMSRATDGAFDITIAPLADALGFGPSGPRTGAPDDSVLTNLRAATGWQKLQADGAAGTLRKSNAALKIDLGAMLQGYAADRMGAILRDAGVHDFLVDVGGELLASGIWETGIEDPTRPDRVLRRVRLENAALATSGIYRRDASGTRQRHILDARTGAPVANDVILTAVQADTALQADLLATALLIRPDLTNPDARGTLTARESGEEVRVTGTGTLERAPAEW